MKGLRIFERFGFNLPKNTKRKAIGPRLVTEFHEWVFLPEYHDWHSAENELVLSAYAPPNGLTELLKNGIESKLD